MGKVTGVAITANPALEDHRPDRRPLMACICPTRSCMEASSARSSLTDCGPFWRAFPLAADAALPSIDFGPVDDFQGWLARAACRSRSRPASLSPRRLAWFLRPASTLLGFGQGDGPSIDFVSRVAAQFAVDRLLFD